MTNVIWTDETTVQLENHCRLATGNVEKSLVQNQSQAIIFQAKTSCDNTCLGGISMNGRTDLVMFDGIMLYVRILREASTQRLYPGGNYLFMQDNDPKHTSKLARGFFADNGIE